MTGGPQEPEVPGPEVPGPEVPGPEVPEPEHHHEREHLHDHQGEHEHEHEHEQIFGDELTPTEAAAEVEDEETTSRSEAIVAILIVAATLAAAVVGYLQVWSSGRSDQAAAVAQRDAVVATARQARADQWADVQVSLVSRAALALAQANEATLQAQVFGTKVTTEDRLEGARLHKLSDRFSEMADTVSHDFTGIPIQGRLSQEQDPSFPTRFVNETSRDPIRLRALEDAANQESSGWSSRAATYTAVLTLFAVALYLLGFSMALPASLGRWFVRGGIVFVAVGLVWAALSSTSRPQAPSEEAAAAFATGTVALSSAFDAYDTSGYREAEDELSKAIEERPDFARAYLNRGQATYFADSPTYGLGTVTSPEGLRSSIEDLKRAVDLGLDDALAVGNVGALSFQEAMLEDRPELLDQALDYTKRVLAIDAERPLWLYNLAVIQLAGGDRDAAMDTYRHADRAALRQPSTAGYWATGALSALEVLAEHRTEESAAAVEAKELVMKEVFGAGGSSDPSDLGLDLVITPSLLQIAIPADQAAKIDPAKDTVVAQTYYDDPSHQGYTVLPEVSGTVSFSRGDDGGLFALLPYLPTASPPRCLVDGSYRVELYVNGHLAATKEIPATFGPQRTVTDPGLNATFCVPGGWQQNPVSTPGVTQAWTLPDGSEGVVLIRAQIPPGLRKVPLTSILDLAVKGFASELIPSLGEPGQPSAFFFMGLTRPTELRYPYDNGALLGGIGLDPAEGAVVVGIAYGPADREAAIQLVFQSLSSYQLVPPG